MTTLASPRPTATRTHRRPLSSVTFYLVLTLLGTVADLAMPRRAARLRIALRRFNGEKVRHV